MSGQVDSEVVLVSLPVSFTCWPHLLPETLQRVSPAFIQATLASLLRLPLHLRPCAVSGAPRA